MLMTSLKMMTKAAAADAAAVRTTTNES